MNKLIFLMVIVLTFVGCTLIPQKYDNNEYLLLAQAEVLTTMVNENCNEPKKVIPILSSLEVTVRTLNTYSFYTPRNDDVYEMTQILKKDVNELSNQYESNTQTPTYCKIKTRLLVDKIRRVLEAVGKKIR